MNIMDHWSDGLSPYPPFISYFLRKHRKRSRMHAFHYMCNIFRCYVITMEKHLKIFFHCALENDDRTQKKAHTH